MKAYRTLIGTALLGSALSLAACATSSPGAQPAPSAPATWSAPATASGAPSPAPSESPAPVSSDPSPATGKCAYPSAGIPDKLMVRDVFRMGTNVTENCVDRGVDDAYFEYLPDPCGRDLGVRTSSIVARRAIEVIFDDDPSNDQAQASMYRHAVTFYNSADAASAYLSSVRAAVRECPERKLKFSTWKYAIASSTTERLELTVRHIQLTEVEGGGPKEATFRVSVARSGARVSVISDMGWEGAPSYDSAVDALVRAAAEQLDR